MSFHTPLPALIYQAKAVREIDRTAIEDCGIPGFELMQRAARFALHALLKRWPDTTHLSILCGSGNNAGDGYVMAALARRKGLQVELFYLSDPKQLSGDAHRAYMMSQEQETSCKAFSSAEWLRRTGLDATHEVIVDALLGTGLHSEVRGHYREAIAAMNEAGNPVFAVDIPSGLCADTGQVLGLAVHAHATASFIAMKLGLLTGAGRSHSGTLYFDTLETPEAALKSQTPCACRLELDALLTQLPPRRMDSHKGHFGHVLLIGGDHGYGGAIQLAARAAARMGPGLISVATQAANAMALVQQQPEIMAHHVPNIHALRPLLDKASHIVVGPGLGQSAWSQQMLFAALESDKPCVLDADALNLIASEQVALSGQHIFTPHPGEAGRLLGCSTSDIQRDRLQSVLDLQRKLGGSMLLKGSGSLIAHPQGMVRLCSDGNPGMASGGMGDVLSGLIGGLFAQGFGPELSLELAVALHAKAADQIAESAGMRGMLAGDLITAARDLLNRTCIAKIDREA